MILRAMEFRIDSTPEATQFRRAVFGVVADISQDCFTSLLEDSDGVLYRAELPIAEVRPEDIVLLKIDAQFNADICFADDGIQIDRLVGMTFRLPEPPTQAEVDAAALGTKED
jgi:hypothetical protein